MKWAVLMDEWQTLQPHKDSTLAMMQSICALDKTCVYFTQKDLFCRDGHAYANAHEVTLANDGFALDWQGMRPLGEQPLAAFDVILMRKDPPFDMEYIYSTYALELAEKEGVLVVNRPQSLRDVSEKYATLHFPECCPPMLVSRDTLRLRSFWETHRHVIFKPLDGMGGQSVFHVDDDGRNLSVILEILTQQETVSIMAQRYIPDIRTLGDKRILLINGEPVPFALARIPRAGELRGNLAAGAKGEVVPITDRDRWICGRLAPMLREKGLYFVGIDVIGDYLTEINVTSPTCLREITAVTGLDIAGDYIRFLSSLVKS